MPKGIIIVGSNSKAKYVEMRKRLVKSIRANAPGHFIEEHDFGKIPASEAQCKRGQLMLDALVRGEGAVLWLDSDMLVRKPLDSFWNMVSGHTLRVLCRPKLDERFKFNTGLIALGNSENTKDLAKRWIRGMEEEPMPYADQVHLWRAFDKAPHKIELLAIDERYNDNHFQESSVIWHAKGHSAERNKAWDKECERYD